MQSPRDMLNCQALSVHLPPLGGQRRDSLSGHNYISPPMSASWDRTKFDDHCPNGRRQYSATPPSRPSTSSHQSTSSRPSTSGRISPVDKRTLHSSKKPVKSVRGMLTPSSTDAEASGTQMKLGSDAHGLRGDSNDELSSNAHDSPEGQLVAGPPGIARRAKAHVPSACVNCKKKHLACETKRPCNRCVQTGKEVSAYKFNVS